MAALPLELLSLSDLDGPVREHIEHLYEKIHGACRWFEIGINGVLFPLEGEDPSLNASYIDLFLADRRPDEQERLAQFFHALKNILREHHAGFEGTFEVLSKEEMERPGLLKILYALRPFWRWY